MTVPPLPFLPSAMAAGGARHLAARNARTGRGLADRAELAATRLRRLVGLIGRRRLGPGEGLCLVPSRGVHTWGMRFPIDIVALDRHGVVVDAVAGLRPWRIRLPRPGTAGTLELPAGTLLRTGTRVGDRIELSMDRTRGERCA